MQGPTMPFTPTTPHFFQPLLPGFQNHLSIPLSFFKCYLKGQIDCETSSAVLRSYGRTWSVKIRSGRFEDGWEDFTRDHDLHVGDFLVFGYGGNMVFDVVVFDTSACRRECPQLATGSKEPANEIGNTGDHIAKKKEKRPLHDASSAPPSEKRAKGADAVADHHAVFNSGAPAVEESSKSTGGGSALFDWATKNWPAAEIQGFRKMPSSQLLQSSVSLLMQAISMQLGVHDAASDVETLVKEKEELELKLQTLEVEFKAMKEQLETAKKQREIEVATHVEELKNVGNKLDQEKAKRAELEQSLEKEQSMKTELMEQIDYTGASYRQCTLFEVQLQYGPLNFLGIPFELLRTPPDGFDVLKPSEEDIQRVRRITTTVQEAAGVACGGVVVESTTSSAAENGFTDDN